jgi:hypothetical protein
MIDLELTKSLFLLFLVVCGNYIGELLGCQTQKLLSDNMYAKHITLVCLIFFTINLIGDTKLHPVEVAQKSVLLWLFYLILTKMNVQVTLVVLCLLFTLYVFDEYQSYLDESKEDYDKEQYETYKLYLQYAIMMIMVFGFITYYMKQRKEHRKDFNLVSFLVGTSQCDFKQRK